MLLWKRWENAKRTAFWDVSILVLLDVALKDLRNVAQKRRESYVSILVLLDVALKDAAAGALTANLKFQSLFSWMLLWKPSTVTSDAVAIGVSILVLLDVALKGDSARSVLPEFYLFQSLFSWMLLWKGGSRRVSASAIVCFNPCSLGCCSERVIFSPLDLLRIVVSILVLLDVALKES